MGICHLRVKRLLGAVTIVSALTLSAQPRSVAQKLLSEDSRVERQQLLQGPLPQPSASSRQPSQTGLTLPSLWWIDRQFGQKLVIDWFAYDSPDPQKQQVQVFVRSNLWTRFSYLERYAFVTHFGSLARSYGYQMLVLDPRGIPIASYICDFDTQQPETVLGARDARNQPIRAYTVPTQGQLPCDLWMSNAFPRRLL